MNIRKKLFVLLSIFAFSSLLLKSNKIYAQSINGSWTSSDNSICMTFHDSVNGMIINGWYDPIFYGFYRMQYKIKNGELQFIHFYNQNFLYWEKQKFLFKIVALTENKLIIELIKTKQEFFMELTNDERTLEYPFIVELTKSKDACVIN